MCRRYMILRRAKECAGAQSIEKKSAKDAMRARVTRARALRARGGAIGWREPRRCGRCAARAQAKARDIMRCVMRDDRPNPAKSR